MIDLPLSRQLSMVCIVALGIGVVGATSATPVASQSTPSQPMQMAQSSSLNGNWRLTVMGELASPGVVPQSTELTAEFAGDRLSGSGGCNRFTGGFQAQDDQLTVGPLASTFMACEEPVMNQETRYLTALQGAQRFEVEGNNLAIYYQTEQETGVLRYVRQAVRGLW